MNYTMSDLENAFREGFQSSQIGDEDKAWEESKTKAMEKDFCCGYPLTMDGYCRLSGQKIRK